MKKDGTLSLIRALASKEVVSVYRVHNKLVLFSSKDATTSWNGHGFEPLREPLAAVNRCEVASVQEYDDDTVYCSSSLGVMECDKRGCREIKCDTIWHSLVGAVRIGDTMILGDYVEGLYAYDIKSGHPLWRLVRSDIGNVYCVYRYGSGLLVGTGDGIYVILDPRNFQFIRLPHGKFTCMAEDHGKTIVSLGTSVITLDTKPADFDVPPQGLLPLASGGFAIGAMGHIRIGEKRVFLGGRDVPEMAELASGKIAAVQSEALSIVGNDKVLARARVPGVGLTVSALPNGSIFVATSDGVLVFDENANQVGTYGKGWTYTKKLGRGVVIFSEDGALVDEQHRLIGQLPRAYMGSVTEWNGDVWALCKLVDGTRSIGRIDSVSKQWIPYDFPAPNVPEALTVQDGKLYVISDDYILQVNTPEPLAAPSCDFRVTTADGKELQNQSEVGTDTETVNIRLPRARLRPWTNPSYSVDLGDGLWTPVQAGAIVPVPRLRTGKSTFGLRAEHGGLVSTREFTIIRRLPWWFRWPMVLVYCAGGAGVLVGSVRLRTRALVRRNRRLEAMVDERTRELIQAQRAREDFFSGLSHEIRNPLNGVTGLCDMLASSPAIAGAPRERVLLRTLKDCSEQLRSILDDILDFSKIDRGEIQLNKEPFELCSAVESALRAIDPNLEHCVLQLPSTPAWLLGDVGKIRQIITNLASNALKYGVPSAAIITANLSGENSGEVSIAVKNTGPTIAPETLANLFKEFVRGPEAVRRRVPGTGLGLATSQRLVQAMGGSITATSENGSTVFAVQLALSVAEAPAIEPGLASAADARTPKHGRVLAIEDETYNRMVLGDQLDQLGYEVDWAVDRASARQNASTGSYDLILADLMLPDGSGMELARELLEILPRPHPPIIAVTAYSTPEKIAEARAAGICGFVTKPVSLKKLEKAILNAIPLAPLSPTSDPVQSDRFDFSPLLRLENGRQKLAEYAIALGKSWETVVRVCTDNPGTPASIQVVHAFRSQVAAVHDQISGEHLALLEHASAANDTEAIRAQLATLAPLISDLSAAAQHDAFS